MNIKEFNKKIEELGFKNSLGEYRLLKYRISIHDQEDGGILIRVPELFPRDCKSIGFDDLNEGYKYLENLLSKKEINETNFFNNTICDWKLVEWETSYQEELLCQIKPNHISYKKGFRFLSLDKIIKENDYRGLFDTEEMSAKYYYSVHGVYRLSDHWGVVGNCIWEIPFSGNGLKIDLGFCRWEDFKLIK